MKIPLISVIIPIYNVEDYLEACIQSLNEQSYSNIELIFVNDKTPDNSMEIVERWLPLIKERFQVQVIQHIVNSGLSEARNTGVRNAKGTYLYFLDSDDEIPVHAMDLFANAIAETPVDFIVGGMQVIGSDLEFPMKGTGIVNGTDSIFSDFANDRWNVMACNKLINKDFFIHSDLWFEPGLLHEDELFSFKLALSAEKMSYIPEVTYIYKIRQQGSITSMRSYKNLEHLMYINKKRYQLLSRYDGKISAMDFYKIKTTFAYLVLIICNDLIDEKQRVDLRSQQLSCYNILKVKATCFSLSTLIKKIIISAPYSIQRMILNYCYKKRFA